MLLIWSICLIFITFGEYDYSLSILFKPLHNKLQKQDDWYGDYNDTRIIYVNIDMAVLGVRNDFTIICNEALDDKCKTGAPFNQIYSTLGIC